MMESNKINEFSLANNVASSLQLNRSAPNLDDELAEKSPLLEVRAIELLPELFGILLDFDRGDVQAKDFDNSLGTIRLKLSMLIQKLQSLEGICDSICDQRLSIAKLNESIKVKEASSCEFRQRVLSKLYSKSLNE